MAKRNRRKRSHSAATSADDHPRSSSSAWKPVNVDLGRPTYQQIKKKDARDLGDDGGYKNNNDDEHNGHDEEAEFDDYNHYDNEKLSKIADNDLHLQPGEDCAMFFGLEVLDASDYEVVGTGSSKRLLITNNKTTTVDDGDDQNNNSDDKDEAVPTSSDGDGPPEKKRKKEKKKKKSKKKKEELDKSMEDASYTNNAETAQSTQMDAHISSNSDTGTCLPSDEDIQSTALSWSQGTGGANLHGQLIQSLSRLGFKSPTPIQAATLSASIMGRRNMVGAAPTGSGKTLAFLLPILNKLLNDQDDLKNQDDDEEEGTSNNDYDHGTGRTYNNRSNTTIKALIMTPTRELATQIHKECEKLVQNQCVALVGGIALVKQVRLLETKRPSIIVGTPGRVYQMLASGEHEHLRDLSNINFLVLDEADRMTQEHSFPQLIKILDMVNEANPADDESDDEDIDTDSEEEDLSDRLVGLPGVPGEAHLSMLSDDLLGQIESQRNEMNPEAKEVEDETFDTQIETRDVEEQVGELEEDMPVEWLTGAPRVHRQTFIFSATLTLPFTSTKTSSLPSRRSRKLGLQGGIAEILEKAKATGETKVVDLSSSSSSSGSNRREAKTTRHDNGVKLPPGLSVEQIKCTQRHKDAHLYAYLMTTSQGSSGPCLVFCNSIAAVRRVGSTLQALGFEVRILHAHMQQRARFKAVESLKNSSSRAVVVCTDVAARGLDIPSVSTVVHYDVARSVDTFVHRSGRTARGMGEGAKGSSMSLVAPAEDKSHSKIAEAVNVSFKKVLLDGRLLTASQERTNLASKVVESAELEKKANSNKNWFLEKAKEADLDLDDDLVEDESTLSEKEQQRIREAQRARMRLAQLLAEPMKTQRFGKFLSTNSAALVAEIQPLTKSSR